MVIHDSNDRVINVSNERIFNVSNGIVSTPIYLEHVVHQVGMDQIQSLREVVRQGRTVQAISLVVHFHGPFVEHFHCNGGLDVWRVVVSMTNPAGRLPMDLPPTLTT